MRNKEPSIHGDFDRAGEAPAKKTGVNHSYDHSTNLGARPGMSAESSLSYEKRILRERAKALAREPDTIDPTRAYVGVIEFLLGQERYGIEVSYVREVHPLKELTLVPCTPSFVLGIMSLRGQILSVIDIRQFFDLPQKGMTDDAKVVVVHTDKTEVGILADLVQGVRKTAFDELQAGLPTLTGIPQDYLKGITKDRMVILNVDRLLSDDRFIVYETVGD